MVSTRQGKNSDSPATEVKTPKKKGSASGAIKSPNGGENNDNKEKSPSPPVTSSNPPRHEAIKYEFGGPIGALGVIIGLPVVIWALYFLCNGDVCVTNPLTFDWEGLVKSLASKTIEDFISYEAVAMYVGWMTFHIASERILPGEEVEGAVLPDGSKLKYIMSGHLQFWLSLIAMGHGIPLLIESVPGVFQIKGFRPFDLSLIYDHYAQLITASVIGASILSIYLYVSSFIGKKILAKGGNTGSVIYDFFIGRELNPRIGSLDLKEFCELRPGLIGWFIINLGMAFKQYAKRRVATGSGSISLSMLLVTAFQGFYVWDALYMEKAILTTMDITTDGFGYMLAFGDLSWVPFIYSLQARYLVDHDPELPLWHIGLVAAVHFLGYYIFRSANSQKDAFRRDPNAPEVAHLTSLPTKRGTKLLTSGWWGAARKINYTGDWLITFSWCLLCGFKSPIPYFQAAYFLVLLVHRAVRDDEMCAEKYGDDWVEYKKRVPYLFVPFVW